MEPARVYKIKIRENILRQVIFTNKNLLLGFVIITILLVWKGLGDLPTDIKVLTSLSISGLSLLLFSIKIDRQSVLKLIPRIFNYSKNRKKMRF
mgnify:CR=1 FL=1